MSLVIARAMSSTYSGLKYSPASWITSLNTGMVEAATGQPQAIASIAESPNPSQREG